MNKFCGNCGNAISEGELFCKKCGVNLNNTVQNGNNVNTNNNNSHNGLSIASLVLGIISLLGGGILFLLPLIGLILGIFYKKKTKHICVGLIINAIVLPLSLLLLLIFGVFFISNIKMNSKVDLNDNIYDYNYNYDNESDINSYNDENYNIDVDDSYDEEEDYVDDSYDVDDDIINTTYFREISYNEAIRKLNDTEDWILLLSSTQCSYCISYKPKIESLANTYKVNVYYININLLDTDQANNLNSYIDFSGTPTTVFFKNGQMDKLSGDVDIDRIEKKFKDNGFIN